jgi:hypothetical protein
MSEYWGDITESEARWKMARWKKFTASEMHKIAKGKAATTKSPAKFFSDAGVTYIKKVAREGYTTYNDRDDVSTKAMANGNRDEPQAFAHLCRLIGVSNLMYCGPDNKIFKPYCDNSGASPDAVALKEDGTAYFGAEIKCKTNDVHWDHLFEIGDDPVCFKEKMFDFWVQCQFLMMSFKCDLWLFTYYNESYPFTDMMKIIEVKSDRIFQSDLALRLKQAIIIKDKLIQLRKENYRGDVSSYFN